jgi:predicted oxidoreductase
LLHHPAKVMPVVGTVDVSRIQKLANADKVPMDRQTWFELYECANGCEVP